MQQDGHYFTVAPRKDAEQPRRKRRSSFASSTPVPPDSEYSDGDSGHPLDDDEEPDDLHNRTHSSVSRTDTAFSSSFPFFFSAYLRANPSPPAAGAKRVAESGHSQPTDL